MADITMCNNANCPLSGNCYRKQAAPNKHWQSIQHFNFEVGIGGAECPSMIPMYKIEQTNMTIHKPVLFE